MFPQIIWRWTWNHFSLIGKRREAEGVNSLPWRVCSKGRKMLLQLKLQHHKPFQVAKYKSKTPAQGKYGSAKEMNILIKRFLLFFGILHLVSMYVLMTNPLLTQTYTKRPDAEYLVPFNIRYILQTTKS